MNIWYGSTEVGRPRKTKKKKHKVQRKKVLKISARLHQGMAEAEKEAHLDICPID